MIHFVFVTIPKAELCSESSAPHHAGSSWMLTLLHPPSRKASIPFARVLSQLPCAEAHPPPSAVWDPCYISRWLSLSSLREEGFSASFVTFPSCITCNFFDTDLKIWHCLDFLKSLSGKTKNKKQNNKTQTKPNQLALKISLSMSLQEVDVDLQLFSAVKFISFTSSGSCIKERSLRHLCFLSRSKITHAALISYFAAKPHRQFILTYVSSWSQLTAVSLPV